MHLRRGPQAGFTLIELMVAVAIIAVLAALVVPSWAKQTRKSKAKSEVAAMFAELMYREETYEQNKGTYKDAATCPASPSKGGQDASSCVASGTDWTTLGVTLPVKTLYCTYKITTGEPGTTPAPPSQFTMPQSGAIATSWYYIVATCNMTGSTTNSTYFATSLSSAYQSNNEGW